MGNLVGNTKYYYWDGALTVAEAVSLENLYLIELEQFKWLNAADALKPLRISELIISVRAKYLKQNTNIINFPQRNQILLHLKFYQINKVFILLYHFLLLLLLLLLL